VISHGDTAVFEPRIQCMKFLPNLVFHCLEMRFFCLEKMIIRLGMKRENLPPQKHVCFGVLIL